MKIEMNQCFTQEKMIPENKWIIDKMIYLYIMIAATLKRKSKKK